MDAHGARNAWLLVFRYRVDFETQPVVARTPTRIKGVWLANLTLDDFKTTHAGL